MEQVNSLLSVFDNVNNSNQISVFIPSLDRKVKFKLLTAKQHKDILSTIMDKNTAGISLSLILTSIIKDNSIEKIDYLTTDKTYILLALRCYSLLKTIKVDETEYNLESYLENTIPFNSKLKEAQIQESTYTINAAVPTLDKDASVNRESKKKLTEVADEADAGKQSLSEVYINEFIKYITSIEYSTGNGNTTIKFDDLSYNQKRQIIEKLPLSTATKLIEYSSKLKEEEQRFLTIVNSGKLNVSIDQSFFTI